MVNDLLEFASDVSRNEAPIGRLERTRTGYCSRYAGSFIPCVVSCNPCSGYCSPYVGSCSHNEGCCSNMSTNERALPV